MHALFYFTWAARLTAVEARKQVGDGTRDDPDDPDDRVQLQATTNGRGKGEVITRQHMGNFSLVRIEKKYKKRQALPMFLTEYMAAPKVKGVFVVRARRPHPMIQVAAIFSFIVSRNRYANGDLAMILGVWHFACKSHIDVKRVYCRLGGSVSDSTARDALVSITTTSSFADLCAKVQDAEKRKQREHRVLLDNVQQYCDVYEQGIGRQSQLKVGCAGTHVELQDCELGAFDAADYYARVAEQARKTLTVFSLYNDINWEHIFGVPNLQWVRVVAEFAPHLNPLLSAISIAFRTAPIAQHRMDPNRPPTIFQPFGTNWEHETETQGMERADRDFDVQMGIDPEHDSGLLSSVCGDGASYANLLRLSKYCAPMGDKFRNKISTPEIWHTGATDLNSIAANHYGPATSSDPSSLSKASNAAGFKRPSNIKSCDYYPTMRNLELIWTAHVFLTVGGRIFFATDDLLEYFADLAKTGNLPTLETLLEYAALLIDRYISQAAPEHAMSAEEATSSEYENRVPEGSPWVASACSSTASEALPTDMDSMPDLVDIEEPTAAHPSEPSNETTDVPEHHQELPGFTGDPVPEGDIGRVWEIMKIWIFKLAGSSHQNYMAYLLEVYCFLKYEASTDLKNAILNNWLVNVEGELGKWLPGDLHQEHYNRWLEDMVQKHGGEFDNKFYRQTISPNVHHFLRIKEEITTSFSLKRRSKTHTSPHLRNELRLLLALFKEQEIYFFRTGRSMGHAAVHQFARGCRRLEEGKLDEWLEKSTCLGDFLNELHRTHDAPRTPELRTDSPSQDENPERSSSPRSASPAPSTAHSDRSGTGSTRSTNSVNSVYSVQSIISSPDPNEPDDDGDDRTGCKLSSGSYNAAYTDPDTGFLTHDDEEEEEDIEREAEVEIEIEEEVEDEEFSAYYKALVDANNSDSD
ncbi:hypothetical protein B0H17DRAFT_1204550 [Mycena rosella]|uniref:DUF6589 domain-containing protein n=1 Tax=Mycena rosella TaxID=1033263 RepID=A0AAD7D978_MYCRO|nr:hypothetical protein B0H17DRAFT_1204550 [Mycena rosella]